MVRSQSFLGQRIATSRQAIGTKLLSPVSLIQAARVRFDPGFLIIFDCRRPKETAPSETRITWPGRTRARLQVTNFTCPSFSFGGAKSLVHKIELPLIERNVTENSSSSGGVVVEEGAVNSR